jgi:putative redox protein
MSIIQDVSFAGPLGQQLAGKLHLPQGSYRGAAIFAHCFTCSKETLAASRIAAGLARAGLAVLRFDFTGLGRSEGAFSDSSFASNIEDLKAAAQFMAAEKFGTHSLAPHLLIGHSLGGAAVLVAASEIGTISAVATIGAPSFAGHVLHLFDQAVDEIEANGQADVHIGGRPFVVGAGMVQDLKTRMTAEHIADLRCDLLVLHSPIDSIVGIENAAEIFAHAKHPKSFVSLDKANHLLTDAGDANFAAEVISSWAQRCLPRAEKLSLSKEGEVLVSASPDGDFAHDILAGSYLMRAYEPDTVPGGLDSGPPPYDFLLAGLGACTAMTLRLYARHKGWPLDDVAVQLRHKKDYLEDNKQAGKLDFIDRTIFLKGDLDEDMRRRLLEIADKCPVHKSLEAGIQVTTSLS